MALIGLFISVGTALADDVTITLNDSEQKALMQVCEAAKWANRMLAGDCEGYFQKKFAEARAPKKDEPKQ